MITVKYFLVYSLVAVAIPFTSAFLLLDSSFSNSFALDHRESGMGSGAGVSKCFYVGIQDILSVTKITITYLVQIYMCSYMIMHSNQG